MATIKDYKLGEVFEYEGDWLRCVMDDHRAHGCEACYLLDRNCRLHDLACVHAWRADDHDVHFVLHEVPT